MKTAADTFANPECDKLVSFFVCDTMERGVPRTKNCEIGANGLAIIVR